MQDFRLIVTGCGFKADISHRSQPCFDIHSVVMASNHSSLCPVSSDETCFHLPNPEFDRAHLRVSANLITAIINAVFSPFAMTANLLTALVILKNPSLRRPSNVLLGCLAASDFLVGLALQPSYVAYRLLENHCNFVPCGVRMFYSTGFYILFGGSFMTLCVISYERYVAVKLHGRYNKVVRASRLFKQAVIVWFVNIGLNFLQWAEINRAVRGVHLALWLACLLAVLIFYCFIHQIVRRHSRRQNARYEPFNSTAARRFKMEVKVSVSIAFIVGIYCLFNLPVLLLTLYHQIVMGTIASYDFYSWAETMALLNSSINPVVCYWRNTSIRRAVVRLLKHDCRAARDPADILPMADRISTEDRRRRSSVRRLSLSDRGQNTRQKAHGLEVVLWMSAV